MKLLAQVSAMDIDLNHCQIFLIRIVMFSQVVTQNSKLNTDRGRLFTGALNFKVDFK